MQGLKIMGEHSTNLRTAAISNKGAGLVFIQFPYIRFYLLYFSSDVQLKSAIPTSNKTLKIRTSKSMDNGGKDQEKDRKSKIGKLSISNSKTYAYVTTDTSKDSDEPKHFTTDHMTANLINRRRYLDSYEPTDRSKQYKYLPIVNPFELGSVSKTISTVSGIQVPSNSHHSENDKNFKTIVLPTKALNSVPKTIFLLPSRIGTRPSLVTQRVNTVRVSHTASNKHYRPLQKPNPLTDGKNIVLSIDVQEGTDPDKITSGENEVQEEMSSNDTTLVSNETESELLVNETGPLMVVMSNQHVTASTSDAPQHKTLSSTVGSYPLLNRISAHVAKAAQVLSTVLPLIHHKATRKSSKINKRKLVEIEPPESQDSDLFNDDKSFASMDNLFDSVTKDVANSDFNSQDIEMNIMKAGAEPSKSSNQEVSRHSSNAENIHPTKGIDRFSNKSQGQQIKMVKISLENSKSRSISYSASLVTPVAQISSLKPQLIPLTSTASLTSQNQSKTIPLIPLTSTAPLTSQSQSKTIPLDSGAVLNTVTASHLHSKPDIMLHPTKASTNHLPFIISTLPTQTVKFAPRSTATQLVASVSFQSKTELLIPFAPTASFTSPSTDRGILFHTENSSNSLAGSHVDSKPELVLQPTMIASRLSANIIPPSSTQALKSSPVSTKPQLVSSGSFRSSDLNHQFSPSASIASLTSLSSITTLFFNTSTSVTSSSAGHVGSKTDLILQPTAIATRRLPLTMSALQTQALESVPEPTKTKSMLNIPFQSSNMTSKDALNEYSLQQNIITHAISFHKSVSIAVDLPLGRSASSKPKQLDHINSGVISVTSATENNPSAKLETLPFILASTPAVSIKNLIQSGVLFSRSTAYDDNQYSQDLSLANKSLMPSYMPLQDTTTLALGPSLTFDLEKAKQQEKSAHGFAPLAKEISQPASTKGLSSSIKSQLDSKFVLPSPLLGSFDILGSFDTSGGLVATTLAKSIRKDSKLATNQTLVYLLGPSPSYSSTNSFDQVGQKREEIIISHLPVKKPQNATYSDHSGHSLHPSFLSNKIEGSPSEVKSEVEYRQISTVFSNDSQRPSISNISGHPSQGMSVNNSTDSVSFINVNNRMVMIPALSSSNVNSMPTFNQTLLHVLNTTPTYSSVYNFNTVVQKRDKIPPASQLTTAPNTSMNILVYNMSLSPSPSLHYVATSTSVSNVTHRGNLPQMSTLPESNTFLELPSSSPTLSTSDIGSNESNLFGSSELMSIRSAKSIRKDSKLATNETLVYLPGPSPSYSSTDSFDQVGQKREEIIISHLPVKKPQNATYSDHSGHSLHPSFLSNKIEGSPSEVKSEVEYRQISTVFSSDSQRPSISDISGHPSQGMSVNNSTDSVSFVKVNNRMVMIPTLSSSNMTSTPTFNQTLLHVLNTTPTYSSVYNFNTVVQKRDKIPPASQLTTAPNTSMNILVYNMSLSPSPSLHYVATSTSVSNVTHRGNLPQMSTLPESNTFLELPSSSPTLSTSDIGSNESNLFGSSELMSIRSAKSIRKDSKLATNETLVYLPGPSPSYSSTDSFDQVGQKREEIIISHLPVKKPQNATYSDHSGHSLHPSFLSNKIEGSPSEVKSEVEYRQISTVFSSDSQRPSISDISGHPSQGMSVNNSTDSVSFIKVNNRMVMIPTLSSSNITSTPTFNQTLLHVLNTTPTYSSVYNFNTVVQKRDKIPPASQLTTAPNTSMNILVYNMSLSPSPSLHYVATSTSVSNVTHRGNLPQMSTLPESNTFLELPSSSPTLSKSDIGSNKSNLFGSSELMSIRSVIFYDSDKSGSFSSAFTPILPSHTSVKPMYWKPGTSIDSNISKQENISSNPFINSLVSQVEDLVINETTAAKSFQNLTILVNKLETLVNTEAKVQNVSENHLTTNNSLPSTATSDIQNKTFENIVFKLNYLTALVENLEKEKHSSNSPATVEIKSRSVTATKDSNTMKGAVRTSARLHKLVTKLQVVAKTQANNHSQEHLAAHVNKSLLKPQQLSTQQSNLQSELSPSRIIVPSTPSYGHSNRTDLNSDLMLMNQVMTSPSQIPVISKYVQKSYQSGSTSERVNNITVRINSSSVPLPYYPQSVMNVIDINSSIAFSYPRNLSREIDRLGLHQQNRSLEPGSQIDVPLTVHDNFSQKLTHNSSFDFPSEKLSTRTIMPSHSRQLVPSCDSSIDLYHNYSLRGGFSAGLFAHHGNTRTLEECTKLCCESRKCSVVLMVKDACFTVKCSNKWLCGKVRNTNRKVKTTLVYLTASRAKHNTSIAPSVAFTEVHKIDPDSHLLLPFPVTHKENFSKSTVDTRSFNSSDNHSMLSMPLMNHSSHSQSSAIMMPTEFQNLAFSCQRSISVYTNYSLRGGFAAGLFAHHSKAGTLQKCMKLCCESKGCSVVLMVKNSCFTVTCSNKWLCGKVKNVNANIMTTLAYLTKSSTPVAVLHQKPNREQLHLMDSSKGNRTKNYVDTEISSKINASLQMKHNITFFYNGSQISTNELSNSVVKKDNETSGHSNTTVQTHVVDKHQIDSINLMIKNSLTSTHPTEKLSNQNKRQGKLVTALSAMDGSNSNPKKLQHDESEAYGSVFPTAPPTNPAAVLNKKNTKVESDGNIQSTSSDSVFPDSKIITGKLQQQLAQLDSKSQGHNNDTQKCNFGNVHYETVLSGGWMAGTFTRQRDIRDITKCAERCCDIPDCHVALIMVHCYTVHCYNATVCTPEKPKIEFFRPRLMFIRQPPYYISAKDQKYLQGLIQPATFETNTESGIQNASLVYVQSSPPVENSEVPAFSSKVSISTTLQQSHYYVASSPSLFFSGTNTARMQLSTISSNKTNISLDTSKLLAKFYRGANRISVSQRPHVDPLANSSVSLHKTSLNSLPDSKMLFVSGKISETMSTASVTASVSFSSSQNTDSYSITPTQPSFGDTGNSSDNRTIVSAVSVAPSEHSRQLSSYAKELKSSNLGNESYKMSTASTLQSITVSKIASSSVLGNGRFFEPSSSILTQNLLIKPTVFLANQTENRLILANFFQPEQKAAASQQTSEKNSTTAFPFIIKPSTSALNSLALYNRFGVPVTFSHVGKNVIFKPEDDSEASNSTLNNLPSSIQRQSPSFTILPSLIKPTPALSKLQPSTFTTSLYQGIQFLDNKKIIAPTAPFSYISSGFTPTVSVTVMKKTNVSQPPVTTENTASSVQAKNTSSITNPQDHSTSKSIWINPSSTNSKTESKTSLKELSLLKPTINTTMAASSKDSNVGSSTPFKESSLLVSTQIKAFHQPATNNMAVSSAHSSEASPSIHVPGHPWQKSIQVNPLQLSPVALTQKEVVLPSKAQLQSTSQAITNFPTPYFSKIVFPTSRINVRKSFAATMHSSEIESKQKQLSTHMENLLNLSSTSIIPFKTYTEAANIFNSQNTHRLVSAFSTNVEARQSLAGIIHSSEFESKQTQFIFFIKPTPLPNQIESLLNLNPTSITHFRTHTEAAEISSSQDTPRLVTAFSSNINVEQSLTGIMYSSEIQSKQKQFIFSIKPTSVENLHSLNPTSTVPLKMYTEAAAFSRLQYNLRPMSVFSPSSYVKQSLAGTAHSSQTGSSQRQFMVPIKTTPPLNQVEKQPYLRPSSALLFQARTDVAEDSSSKNKFRTVSASSASFSPYEKPSNQPSLNDAVQSLKRLGSFQSPSEMSVSSMKLEFNDWNSPIASTSKGISREKATTLSKGITDDLMRMNAMKKDEFQSEKPSKSLTMAFNILLNENTQRVDNCLKTILLNNSVLKFGLKAGAFHDEGIEESMEQCVAKCCDKSGCNVAFMLKNHCFLIHCASAETCAAMPAQSSYFNPRLVYVTHNAKDYELFNKLVDEVIPPEINTAAKASNSLTKDKNTLHLVALSSLMIQPQGIKSDDHIFTPVSTVQSHTHSVSQIPVEDKIEMDFVSILKSIFSHKSSIGSTSTEQPLMPVLQRSNARVMHTTTESNLRVPSATTDAALKEYNKHPDLTLTRNVHLNQNALNVPMSFLPHGVIEASSHSAVFQLPQSTYPAIVSTKEKAIQVVNPTPPLINSVVFSRLPSQDVGENSISHDLNTYWTITKDSLKKSSANFKTTDGLNDFKFKALMGTLRQLRSELNGMQPNAVVRKSNLVMQRILSEIQGFKRNQNGLFDKLINASLHRQIAQNSSASNSSISHFDKILVPLPDNKTAGNKEDSSILNIVKEIANKLFSTHVANKLVTEAFTSLHMFPRSSSDLISSTIPPSASYKMLAETVNKASAVSTVLTLMHNETPKELNLTEIILSALDKYDGMKNHDVPSTLSLHMPAASKFQELVGRSTPKISSQKSQFSVTAVNRMIYPTQPASSVILKSVEVSQPNSALSEIMKVLSSITGLIEKSRMMTMPEDLVSTSKSSIATKSTQIESVKETKVSSQGSYDQMNSLMFRVERLSNETKNMKKTLLSKHDQSNADHNAVVQKLIQKEVSKLDFSRTLHKIYSKLKSLSKLKHNLQHEQRDAIKAVMGKIENIASNMTQFKLATDNLKGLDTVSSQNNVYDSQDILKEILSDINVSQVATDESNPVWFSVSTRTFFPMTAISESDVHQTSQPSAISSISTTGMPPTNTSTHVSMKKSYIPTPTAPGWNLDSLYNKLQERLRHAFRIDFSTSSEKNTLPSLSLKTTSFFNKESQTLLDSFKKTAIEHQPISSSPSVFYKSTPITVSTKAVTKMTVLTDDDDSDDDGTNIKSVMEMITPPKLCEHTDILFNYTFSAGFSAGNFTKAGKGNSMNKCISLCCQKDSCDVALLLRRHCFLVECKDANACKPVKAKPAKFIPQFSFMLRSKHKVLNRNSVAHLSSHSLITSKISPTLSRGPLAISVSIQTLVQQQPVTKSIDGSYTASTMHNQVQRTQFDKTVEASYGFQRLASNLQTNSNRDNYQTGFTIGSDTLRRQINQTLLPVSINTSSVSPSKPTQSSPPMTLTTFLPGLNSSSMTSHSIPAYSDQKKSQNLPFCSFSPISYNVTLRYRMGSGYLIDRGEVRDEDECARLCCLSPDCDLAFMLKSFCFLVDCASQDMCEVVKAKPSKYAPKIIFVSRNSTEGSMIAKFRRDELRATRTTVQLPVATVTVGGAGSSPGTKYETSSNTDLQTVISDLSPVNKTQNKSYPTPVTQNHEAENDSKVYDLGDEVFPPTVEQDNQQQQQQKTVTESQMTTSPPTAEKSALHSMPKHSPDSGLTKSNNNVTLPKNILPAFQDEQQPSHDIPVLTPSSGSNLTVSSDNVKLSQSVLSAFQDEQQERNDSPILKNTSDSNSTKNHDKIVLPKNILSTFQDEQQQENNKEIYFTKVAPEDRANAVDEPKTEINQIEGQTDSQKYVETSPNSQSKEDIGNIILTNSSISSFQEELQQRDNKEKYLAKATSEDSPENYTNISSEDEHGHSISHPDNVVPVSNMIERTSLEQTNDISSSWPTTLIMQDPVKKSENYSKITTENPSSSSNNQLSIINYNELSSQGTETYSTIPFVSSPTVFHSARRTDYSSGSGVIDTQPFQHSPTVTMPVSQEKVSESDTESPDIEMEVHNEMKPFIYGPTAFQMVQAVDYSSGSGSLDARPLQHSFAVPPVSQEKATQFDDGSSDIEMEVHNPNDSIISDSPTRLPTSMKSNSDEFNNLAAELSAIADVVDSTEKLTKVSQPEISYQVYNGSAENEPSHTDQQKTSAQYVLPFTKPLPNDQLIPKPIQDTDESVDSLNVDNASTHTKVQSNYGNNNDNITDSSTQDENTLIDYASKGGKKSQSLIQDLSDMTDDIDFDVISPSKEPTFRQPMQHQNSVTKHESRGGKHDLLDMINRIDFDAIASSKEPVSHNSDDHMITSSSQKDANIDSSEPSKHSLPTQLKTVSDTIHNSDHVFDAQDSQNSAKNKDDQNFSQSESQLVATVETRNNEGIKDAPKHLYPSEKNPDHNTAVRHLQIVTTEPHKSLDESIPAKEKQATPANVHGSKSCTYEPIQYGVTFVNGMKDKIFKDHGEIADIFDCIKQCCKSHTCHASFIILNKCYSVLCLDKKSCATVKARTNKYHSKIVYVHHLSKKPEIYSKPADTHRHEMHLEQSKSLQGDDLHQYFKHFPNDNLHQNFKHLPDNAIRHNPKCHDVSLRPGVMRGGLEAGSFKKHGPVKTDMECILKCCDDLECNMIFMLKKFCYGVTCRSAEDCKVFDFPTATYSPRVALIRPISVKKPSSPSHFKKTLIPKRPTDSSAFTTMYVLDPLFMFFGGKKSFLEHAGKEKQGEESYDTPGTKKIKLHDLKLVPETSKDDERGYDKDVITSLSGNAQQERVTKLPSRSFYHQNKVPNSFDQHVSDDTDEYTKENDNEVDQHKPNIYQMNGGSDNIYDNQLPIKRHHHVNYQLRHSAPRVAQGRQRFGSRLSDSDFGSIGASSLSEQSDSDPDMNDGLGHQSEQIDSEVDKPPSDVDDIGDLNNIVHARERKTGLVNPRPSKAKVSEGNERYGFKSAQSDLGSIGAANEGEIVSTDTDLEDTSQLRHGEISFPTEKTESYVDDLGGSNYDDDYQRQPVFHHRKLNVHALPTRHKRPSFKNMKNFVSDVDGQGQSNVEEIVVPPHPTHLSPTLSSLTSNPQDLRHLRGKKKSTSHHQLSLSDSEIDYPYNDNNPSIDDETNKLEDDTDYLSGKEKQIPTRQRKEPLIDSELDDISDVPNAPPTIHVLPRHQGAPGNVHIPTELRYNSQVEQEPYIILKTSKLDHHRLKHPHKQPMVLMPKDDYDALIFDKEIERLNHKKSDDQDVSASPEDELLDREPYDIVDPNMLQTSYGQGRHRNEMKVIRPVHEDLSPDEENYKFIDSVNKKHAISAIHEDEDLGNFPYVIMRHPKIHRQKYFPWEFHSELENDVFDNGHSVRGPQVPSTLADSDFGTLGDENPTMPHLAKARQQVSNKAVVNRTENTLTSTKKPKQETTVSNPKPVIVSINVESYPDSLNPKKDLNLEIRHLTTSRPLTRTAGQPVLPTKAPHTAHKPKATATLKSKQKQQAHHLTTAHHHPTTRHHHPTTRHHRPTTRHHPPTTPPHLKTTHHHPTAKVQPRHTSPHPKKTPTKIHRPTPTRRTPTHKRTAPNNRRTPVHPTPPALHRRTPARHNPTLGRTTHKKRTPTHRMPTKNHRPTPTRHRSTHKRTTHRPTPTRHRPTHKRTTHRPTPTRHRSTHKRTTHRPTPTRHRPTHKRTTHRPTPTRHRPRKRTTHKPTPRRPRPTRKATVANNKRPPVRPTHKPATAHHNVPTRHATRHSIRPTLKLTVKHPNAGLIGTSKKIDAFVSSLMHGKCFYWLLLHNSCFKLQAW